MNYPFFIYQKPVNCFSFHRKKTQHIALQITLYQIIMKAKISNNYHLVQFVRTEATLNTVRGSVYVDGSLACYFLNNRHKPLFTGVYELKHYNSPSHQEKVLLFLDDQDRFIEAHVANYFHQLNGCFALCGGFDGEMGQNSRKALKKVIELTSVKNIIVAEVVNNYQQKGLFS